MLNDDLVAFLEPAPNRFNPNEWRDVTGTLTDLRVEPHRFVLRASLPPGLYRGRIDTRPGAFDMTTAMVPMVRVPDGQRVLVGPWDLDHIRNVMAMPMARTYVNGKLKGGLWFAMPGPEQIAAGRLWADFGFEAEAGETELILEFVERDRERIAWDRMRSIQLRRDDRPLLPLQPGHRRHPRLYVTPGDVPALRKRLLADPAFQAVLAELRTGKPGFGIETQGDADVACLAYLLTGDRAIGEKAKAAVLDVVRLPTWSGRPDPLLMGGDNDRGVGYRLYYTGIAWEFLGRLFAPAERRLVLAKVEEYLIKMYDFTVLQRAYMGHRTADPHSLGAWNGTAIACMAFYDDLDIARRALPLIHGLFVDSLRVFPPGGKTAWATFFPFHLIRYLAAAQTFGGGVPETADSGFLDNLGAALLRCFETPNTQEMQRGLRTREHRYLAAYLCRFHPTPGIAAIYRAFAEQERRAAGNVVPGLFDLLYAPTGKGKPAAFPKEPLFTRDIGDIVAVARGRKTIGLSLSAGLKAGSQASFRVMPHNREFVLPMGNIEMSVDGTPVLISINIGCYGLNSALTNTLCFEDGGMVTQGQYLNGDNPPERSSYLRRCFLDDRFIYAHAVITGALHPDLQVQSAERVFVFDRRSGCVLLADAFSGGRPIRFGTHLHCSGSVRDLGNGCYRLTGGQANLIAGIKGGSKGLSDAEKGEVFVSVLAAGDDTRVTVEEPTWVPAYIYGINSTGNERLEDARYPHYRRWRLEATGPVTAGAFVFALSPEPGEVRLSDGFVRLPQDASVCLAGLKPVRALGCECVAETVIADAKAKRLILIGARRIAAGKRRIEFGQAVDLALDLVAGKPGGGTVFSPARDPGVVAAGFRVGALRPLANDPRTNQSYAAKITAV